METRTNPINLQRTFQILCFDGYLFADTNGFAGGVIVAWRKEVLMVPLISYHLQFLHLKVSFHGGRVFYFTPVYTSPQEEGRNGLWRELKHISNTMDGEWLIAGDFNDIMK
jgi:hypothetical protein